MESAILLDTCALIWVVDDTISEAAAEALNAVSQAGLAVHISPISAWELGLLAARGRLASKMTPLRLFRHMLEIPHVQLAEMSPEILILSSFLPGTPPRDPADRILAATAREFGLTLMTRDKTLLEYAEQGHIRALAC